MGNKIYLRNLPCSKKEGKVSERKKNIMKQHYFDLNLLPTAGQRKELRAFILKRSENLSLSTIDGDTIQFKVLARFMKEKFPYLNSFSAVNEGEIIDCLKDANSHFLRTAGPYFPDSPGHIKRTAWDISRAEGTPPY